MKNIEEFTYTKYNGEMLPFERFKLTNWILNIKPTIVFEVGTGNGGGSTYFIAKALKELNNDGVIYTCDPLRRIDDNMLNEFKNINQRNVTSGSTTETVIKDKKKKIRRKNITIEIVN